MAWSNESRHARGYGWEWEKLRARILRRDMHLCHCPDCKGGAPGGRLRPADEVDHIVSKAEAKRLGWTQEQVDDPSNLRAVNHDCHQRITLAAQGKAPKPKRAVGADGWPA